MQQDDIDDTAGDVTSLHAAARQLWVVTEPLHSTIYFAPEFVDRVRQVGLTGWDAYYGGRLAPLGAVAPRVATALLYGFAPAVVEPAVRALWAALPPQRALTMRHGAAASALRRCLPAADDDRFEALADRLSPIVEACDHAGRPLSAANASLHTPDPAARLWLLATVVREHRGAGHVAALLAADLDGCEAHVLRTAADRAAEVTVRPFRGWTEQEWGAATDRLSGRDLIRDGSLTEAGRTLRAAVEARTDQLASRPLTAVSDVQFAQLVGILRAVSGTVAAAAPIVYPNAVGAPHPHSVDV